MATPGTADYAKSRHNLMLGDLTWRAISIRGAELGIPAGEVIDRAIALVSDLVGDGASDTQLQSAGLLTAEESDALEEAKS